MSNVRTATSVLVCVAAVLSGCASTPAVQPASEALADTTFKAGDRIHVALRDGTEFYLTVESVDSETIVGTDRGGNRHRIDTADVATVASRTGSVGRTAAAVGVTAAGIYLIVAILTAIGTAALLGG